MPAFWSSNAADFLATPPTRIEAEIARHQLRHFMTSRAEQSTAWADSIATLQQALAALGETAANWWVQLEYPMLRLNMRADAILLTERAIIVLEFKRAAADADALRQTEDYALNLLDFHAASRHHPIVPVLVSDAADPARNAPVLLWHGVPPVQQTTPAALAETLRQLHMQIGPPADTLDAPAWIAGAYRPVPTIIEAARMTYARHNVADIAAARADQTNLRETTHAIMAALADARAAAQKLIVFVTGIPGAGKTLCGLNLAFSGAAADATFLTGNPTLVHVLRAALLADAKSQGQNTRNAEHHLRGKIQKLPDFRNEYVQHAAHVPPERIAIIDEAQRCWSRDHAMRKTRDKPVRLTESEPALLLDALGRHPGFAAIICLVGSGQEIHDGEGGIAEWGTALAARPQWTVLAPPDVLDTGDDPRWRLGDAARATSAPLLHLRTATRQIRSTNANAWVDAVLRADADTARAIATSDGALPFTLTRDLSAARAATLAAARGTRRCGMLASSGAKRLRAIGLGSELPHMDAAAVAHWFLGRFPPDIRASDALEQIATEFSCQGLELDCVLLAWDLDLIRPPRPGPWLARQFRGTTWQAIRQPEAAANQLNTYRVLLTRARYETMIYVPRGDANDPTRPPIHYDAIAAFLRLCGARDLADPPANTEPTPDRLHDAQSALDNAQDFARDRKPMQAVLL